MPSFSGIDRLTIKAGTCGQTEIRNMLGYPRPGLHVFCAFCRLSYIGHYRKYTGNAVKQIRAQVPAYTLPRYTTWEFTEPL